MPYDRLLNIRLSMELHRLLEKDAKKKRINISEQVREILIKYYATKKTEAVVDTFLGIVLEDREIKQLIKKKLKEK